MLKENWRFIARVERVGRRRDVDLHEGILVSVVPGDRLLGADRRAGQVGGPGGHVLEDDRAVVGVDVGLHGVTAWGARVVVRAGGKSARLGRAVSR